MKDALVGSIAKFTQITRQSLAFVCQSKSVILYLLLGTSQILVAQEDDYEFEGAASCGSPTSFLWDGSDDATTRLVEGFPGLSAEPGKDRWIEPVDGSGGFDNVAPSLGVEEGPGGLEWDPSPTYRTRYKGGTDYPASSTRLQGNNWFARIPYINYDPGTNQYRARFGGNTFRVFVNSSPTVWVGQHANINSKLVRSGSAGSYVLKIYDIAGKTFTFLETAGFKCTQIDGLGGAQVTFTYNASSIDVLQKPSPTAGNEVRKFTYTVTSNRFDKIDVYEKNGANWDLYRKIDFTYHENITGAVEGSAGDLIGIDEERLLSTAGSWIKRRWVFKYYTGTYNATTNPGYPYQVKAALGPQAVRDFEVANPGVVIYTRTAAQLSSYVDRTYEYEADKRLDELDLKEGCGCGESEGLYTFNWQVNSQTPTNMNTWYRQITITLPAVNGSSKIIDYNLYGQTLNSVTQEVAGTPSSRRWIQTWTRDTTARLTDTYSVKACTSYTDATHVVALSSTTGWRYQFNYDNDNSLLNFKVREPTSGNYYFQGKLDFELQTSGDRRCFRKNSQTNYPTETTTDTGGVSTTFAYTYHASDALATKRRTTTLPVVTTPQNGLNSSVLLYDYFELDGIHTWNRDGDAFVHYTGFDASRRTLTLNVRNLNTANPPSGVPSPPDTVFNTTSGLNLVTGYEYDSQRRMAKHESPAFNAWDGTAVSSVKTTRRWHYTKLSGDEAVEIESPHIDLAYYHSALTLSVQDHDGNVVTAALGELSPAYRNTNLADDFDAAQSTLASGFRGTIVRRTDFVYTGDKLLEQQVWSDADNGAAPKRLTSYAYDAAGRLETTTNPAGTITRYSYNVLSHQKSAKIGTVDGGAGDNMTLVEEIFYDDEEDVGTKVGDGTITREKRYTAVGSAARTTDRVYDYRSRPTTVIEPNDVKLTFTYSNRDELLVTERFQNSTSTRVAKSENVFDSWGQKYEQRVYEVPLVTNKYDRMNIWRNGRGRVTKIQRGGSVFEKIQYDGAGRVINGALSYDTDETAYGDADDLSGDTVIEETRFVLDGVGAQELVRSYERRHNGTGVGSLTVGTSGNARAQYTAGWYDKLHRQTVEVVYGTNGGADLISRPSGSPPSSSSASSLVTKVSYTIKSETQDITDPRALKSTFNYGDAGEQTKKIDNYVDGTPGGPSGESDQDRTVEYIYDSNGRFEKIVAKQAYNDSGTYRDLVTQYVYGVERGVDNSTVSSNDVVYEIRFPDPDSSPPGQPSSDVNDQEVVGYNAQIEVVWKRDALGTQHTLSYDNRGRRIEDKVNALGSGIDTAVQRIGYAYDVLDRPIKVTSYSLPSGGSVVNEVQYEYGPYSTVSKVYQEWFGPVNTGTSRRVSFAYSFPTGGATAVRRSSATYPDGTVLSDTYNAGTDTTINRISGQKLGSNWLYQESYLGYARLAERQFGSTGVRWTLVGTDSSNQDNYFGLDRFGRIDELVVTNGVSELNHYLYSYNYNSQVTLREDTVGNVSGSYIFDESFAYDNLGRLTDHRRGAYSGGSMSSIQTHECWTLDRSGNTTAYYNGTSSGCLSTWTASPNASNEITTWSIGPTGYNDAGEMTTKNANTQQYDAWGRLVKSTAYGTTNLGTYKYNGLGQRIYSLDGAAQVRHYYYNTGNQLVQEYNNDGSVARWYAWGTQYVDDIVYEGSTTVYYAHDGNFNVMARLDSTGAVTARHIHLAYGSPKQLSADWTMFQTMSRNYHLFTGREYLKEPAEYDFRARVQDPELGRFLRRDPIGNWGDPLSGGNGYSYVGLDPVNYVDPFGTCSMCAGQIRDIILSCLKDCLASIAVILVVGESLEGAIDECVLDCVTEYFFGDAVPKTKKDFKKTHKKKVKEGSESFSEELCKGVHRAYDKMKCKRCIETDTVRAIDRKRRCFQREIQLRELYLLKKCDYVLHENAVFASESEAGHRTELVTKKRALRNCDVTRRICVERERKAEEERRRGEANAK